MTSIQNHETSYESGLAPYIHDKGRGRWKNPADFVFACVNNAFGTMHFSGMVFMIFYDKNNMFLGLIYYLLCLGVFVAPIIFIQGFLGQFSSSGYISVFRIAPFFKGLGYYIFFFNFMVLTYVAMLSAVPLFYTIASLTSLPDIIECRNNTWNKPGCKAFIYNETSTVADDNVVFKWEYDRFLFYSDLPSLQYFNHQLNINHKHDGQETSFSWPISICSLIIWCLIYHIHSRGIEWIGKTNRYLTIGLMFTLLIFIVKAFCTDHLTTALKSSFHLQFDDHLKALGTGPILCLQVFGRGWGTVLAMGSHNQFRTNIAHYSLAVILLNILITVGSSFVTIAFYGMLAESTSGIWSNALHPLEVIFVVFPAVFGNLKAPRFFLFVLFLMLTLAEIFGAVILLRSFLTSFFDEHNNLRHLRREITLGFVGFFMFTSTFYCSPIGHNLFFAMTQLKTSTHMLLFVLLILVVMWIYGRERFQRDVYFMLGIRFHTALVYMVRFVTPIICLFLFVAFGIALLLHIIFFGMLELIFVFFLKLLVLLVIPGYMVYTLKKPMGSILSRLKKLNRPTDWYPIDINEKQAYEAALGGSDVAEPLACDDVL